MLDTPTQLIDYRCDLEAVDRSRNISRAYRIEASRDLFGHTVVDLRWGRIGQREGGLTVSFTDEEAARRFIQRALAKRASSPRRIGIAYCFVNELVKPDPTEATAANENC